MIGDLVGSRLLEERAAVQRRLERTLEEMNVHFSDAIRSPFAITTGDEFEGLLDDRCDVGAVWWEYGRRMFDVLTRFGIGVGQLTTDLRGATVGSLDGPCFHAAREGVERAKEEGRAFYFSIHGRPLATEVLNSLAALPNEIIGTWTSVQWETTTAFAALESQTAVAKERGVSKQSVFDVLSAAHSVSCIEAWNGLSALLRLPPEAWP